MTATLGSFPVFRAFDADGAPLVGGFLHSYAAGTLTPLATYVDAAGVTTNANPVVLDSTGSANVWFGSSAYKLVLKTSTGSTLWTVDNYQPDAGSIQLRSDLASTASTALGDALVGVKSALTGGMARTQHDKNADMVSVLDFGADPTGDTNSTDKIQAAIDSGKPVYVPAGTYLIDTLGFPNRPLHFTGAGIGSTTFQQRTANTVMFKTSAFAGDGPLGSILEGFSVKPHASGSTVEAIDTSWFRGACFRDIQGLSNGAKGFLAIFRLGWVCYNNTYEHITLLTTTGYTHALNFANTGDPLDNANQHVIRDSWFVANAGMTSVINALCSAQVLIQGNLIEGNAGAIAIVCGNTTTVMGNFLELNGTDLDFPVITGSSANDCLIMGNYFSTPHNVDYHTTQKGTLWINNTEAGAQTFINSPGVSNVKVKINEIYTPAVPTLLMVPERLGR